MKKSLFSIVTLFIFSVALTACGGGGGGGGGGSAGGGGGGDPFAPSDNTVLNAVDSLPSKNSQKLDDSYDSFDDVSTAANGGTAIDITLGGLAVTLNDITQYTRETTDTAWTDRANLQIDRQITPARITSPFVTFTFDADGNISGVASEYIKAYTATGNAPLSNTRFTGTYQDDELSIDVAIDRSEDFFGFDSAHMAYIGWNVGATLSDDDVATTQTIYDIDGMVIAGIQTMDASIPTDDIADFVGKGSGVYGTKIGRYDTRFDIAGNVSFSARSLSLTTSNTTCTANCDGVNVPSYLNFTATNLSFANADNTASINRISADLKLNSALTGTLDARFYGDKAQEFGGTFALAEASTQTSNGRYYYGAFGARFSEASEFMGGVNTTNINAHNTKVAASPQDTNIGTYDSLSNIGVGAVTLQGLTILLDDTSIYMRETKDTDWTDTQNLNIERTISTSRLTSSAVSLAFAGGVASVTTIYADKTHTPSTATLNVDSSEIFGFDSDYMAYISWSLDKTDLNGEIREEIYDIDGAMIAGIEMNNNAFLASGYATFEGKGKGVYGFLDSSDKLTRYNTSFTTKATVDFMMRHVALTTDTTCTDCGTFDASKLNFTDLSLSFANADNNASINNISKDVTLDSTLTGTLDARFYGGEAQEFGGTFALAEASTDTISGRYYYGAFGAKRGDIASFLNSKITVLNSVNQAAATTPQDTKYSASDTVIAGSNDTILTLKGVAVFLNDTTDYERENEMVAWTETDALKIDRQITVTSLTSPAVTLTFDPDGVISAVTAYTNANYTNATIDRNTIFGFDSDYMAYVNWGSDKAFGDTDAALTQTSHHIDGMMIAGVETDNILTIHGKAQFSGNGAGIYGTKTTRFNTVFGVTATVDFTARDVMLNTVTEACTDCNDFDVSTLDFTNLSLSYTGNNISENITLDSTLTGTLDARFYGTGAKEFGGTFALAEADTRYYYGAFGSEIISSNVTTINAAGILQSRSSQKVDTKGYDSLDAVSTAANGGTAIDVTLQGLAVTMEDITDYTRITTDKTWSDATNLNVNQQITPKRVILPVVALNFDEDGNISSVTAQYINEYTATANAPLSSTAFTGAYMDDDRVIDVNVDRSSNIFGFDSSYMAYVSWDSNETLDETEASDTQIIYDIDGYMVAGIQTNDADIPTFSDFGFAGKGKGVYGTADNEYNTVFDMIAIVNVTDRDITLTASNTICPLYDCSINANHLDFSGTLNYGYDIKAVSVATNDASGIVTGGNGLTGTADARFYGDKAQEFGGTFALASATGYYYGAFGGQPNHVLNYNLDKNIVDSSATGPALNYLTKADLTDTVLIPDLAIARKPDNATYYKSFDELFESDPDLTVGDTKNMTLPAIGHHRYYQYNYQRNDNSVAWNDSNISHDAQIVRNLDSVVSLNFYVDVKDSSRSLFYQYGSENGIKRPSVTIYNGTFDIDENGQVKPIIAQYVANTGNLGKKRTYFRGSMVEVNDTNSGSFIATHRNQNGEHHHSKYFGFTPKYLMSITWAVNLKTNLLDNSSLDGESDLSYGRMITGFETGRDFGSGEFGEIPKTGNATFTGKGGGFYGYKQPIVNSTTLISKRETVVFNVAANVNFANRGMDISIYNTCYYTTCTIKRKGLDFNANLSFDDNGSAVNNISAPITTDNGLLTGTLDTRFYGDEAQEIGGSFVVAGVTDDIYYYGTFATSRENFDGTKDSFSVSKLMYEGFTRHVFEEHYDYPEAVNIPYGSFAKAAGAKEASRFVVRGLAVQQSDITDYVRNGKSTLWTEANKVSEVRDISLARSETPAVALDFDETGNISAIEAYFGFNSYKSTVLANDATDISANGAIANAEYADAETSNIIADRSAFGFDSNYMVYVNWNFAKENLDSTGSVIVDDIYNINGIMIAGIETQTMPSSDVDIAFTGRGKGNYGDEGADDAVSFRAYADVNFADRTVEFETRNTACVDITCTLDADTLNTLNFSKSLSYNIGRNNIDSELNIGDLAGTINANFYGIGDDSGSEFGGTFSLNDNAHYYYGYFGIHEGGIIISAMADSIANVTIPEEDRQPIHIPPNNAGGIPYPWLSLVIDDYKTVTVQGTAAYRTNNIVYTRETGQNDWRERDATDTLSVSTLTGAAATIKPNAYGNLSEVTIYLDNDESYTISDKGHYSNTTFNKAFTKGDVSGHMSISRETSLFGFSPKNIYYIAWTLNKATLSDDDTVLTDNTYTRRGAMLVGSESKISQIPAKSYPALDSLVKFSGEGRGYYNDGSGSEKRTKFKVTANVDFHFKNVALSTSYLYLCRANFSNCGNGSTLNFTTATPLSYGDENGNIISNNVSGAIESRTYGENSNIAAGNFTGTIDAKFYGVKASEFAGTFTLIDDEYNTHYGIFGTKAKFNSSTFGAVNPNLSQTTVVRTAAATGAVSPNASNTRTYEKYDSFFAAQQDAKNGVRYNNYPHHAVHTPALAAFREDTTRYQRITADIDTAWDDDDIIAELSYAGNLYYASSSIRYGGGINGRIYHAQAYGNNVAYGLNNASNQLSGKPNFSSTTNNADKYHYFTGNNLQYTASPQLAKLYPSKVDGNLTVEKPDHFGFTAKYMAYIRWGVAEEKNDLWNGSGADSIYDIDGYMISGFETEHNTRGSDGKSSDDLPMTGEVTFKGKGMGTYHAASRQAYRTSIGNVDAVAKFSEGKVDLTMSNTTCVAGLNSNTCADDAITNALPNLDVAKMTLTFTVGKNNITAIAAETKGGMQGQIDARFYGQNRNGANNQNAAKEFGGAFSFRDGDKSYIGIFGTSCEATGGVCP